jgi:ubiquinone/menaquinone biosynthesis C-methylase UbiE
MSTTPALPPNHHAHMPGFTGLLGVYGAVACLVGRKPDADLAIALTAAGPGDDVVDIGCGPGSAVRRVAKRDVASVTGIDPAPMMLRAARLFGGGRTKRYVLGTAEDLPLGDDDASVVWTLASVHHWRDVDAGLAEIVRILRPGGRFLAVERRVEPGATGLASHGWIDEQAEAFATACTSAGFAEAEVGHHEIAGGRQRLTVLART